MLTMSILRTAAKSHRLFQSCYQNQGLSLHLRESPRSFSTEGATEQPSQGTSSGDAFLRTTSQDIVYAKLIGTTKYTTKRDILNLLEGCELSLDDIKVDYSNSNTGFMPTGMMIQFPSWLAFEAALRANSKRGRLYRLERVSRSLWDLITPYDGKAVLLQGIPKNAVADDIERFLCGCIYEASQIQMFFSQIPFPMRTALVHFPTKTQAMHAFITKNKSFCLNNQVLVRVLH